MRLGNIHHLLKKYFFILLFVPLISSAQTYPTHPIKIIAPFPAGGTSDILARIIAQRLGDVLGQSIIVENKPGANGTIGLDAAAKAPGDGYTLLLCSSGVVLNNPFLYDKLSYDWFKDFKPISMLGTAGQVLAVNPNVPVKNVAELVALAKSKPGQINFGSGGKANTSHLAAEKFMSATRVEITHIPYKGNANATVALVAGEVQMVFADMAPALPFIADKKITPLAVTTFQRSNALPNIPTMAEIGYPNFESVTWWTLVAPKGVSDTIISKLSISLEKVMNSQEVKDGFTKLGINPLYSTPEKVHQIARKDLLTTEEQFKKLNISKE